MYDTNQTSDHYCNECSYYEKKAGKIQVQLQAAHERIAKLEKLAQAAKELDSRCYRYPEDGTPYGESAENFIKALNELKMFECDQEIISAEQWRELEGIK